MTARILPVIISLMIIFTLASCGKKKEEPEEVVRPVKWIVAGENKEKLLVDLPGEVQAVQRAYLAFQVPGQIIELPIIVGDKVKKGQILAKLDDRKYKSELNKAEAFERKAKVDYERYKKLNDDKVVSDKEFEQKRRNYAVAISERRIALKNQNDTTLEAPFDGVIASKSVKNYQNVQAEEKIITLKNLDQLEIVVHVPVRNLKPENRDKYDMYAVINNFKDQKIKLKIREFSTEIDQDTMTYEVTLEMLIPDDLKGKIIPGMLATVYIGWKETEDRPEMILIPVQAVAADAKGNPYVWVINPKDMRVSKRMITTGELSGGDILVKSGLKEKELVAVSGANYLQAGQKVKKYQSKK
jgi:RND family efflux transporter MFP subunit